MKAAPIALLLFALATTAPGMAAERAPMDVLVPPKSLPFDQQTRKGSVYPSGARRDALVYLRITVSEKGDVTEVELEDGGFHSDEFVRAAMLRARSLRFSPATLNGQPVEYKGVTLPLLFRIYGPEGQIKGVTREFRSEAVKVQKLIQGRDFAGAEHHATWMLSEKVALSYEFAVLQATLADSYARVGQYHAALEAARAATARAGMSSQNYTPGGPLPKISDAELMLPKDQLAQQLRLRFALDDSQGNYLDGLRAHADLQALGLVVAEDPTSARFQEMLRMVQTSPTLKAHARIGSKNWRHDLLFHSFTVSGVRGGSLRKIWLMCGDFRRILDYTPDSEWRIPDRYSGCSAAFEGDTGTEFDVIEFRDAPGVAPATATN
jgi:TonB family protein